jgi:DNA-binding Lrp family transcriptional regulator
MQKLGQPHRHAGMLGNRPGRMASSSRRQEGWMRAIFVMIKCEMGQAYRVAQEAADRIPEMSELYSTSGQYDLLGKFYLEPQQDTGLFVTEHVQTLPGVKDTYTLITFNAFTSGG